MIRPSFLYQDLKGGRDETATFTNRSVNGNLAGPGFTSVSERSSGEGAPDYSGVTGIYYTMIGAILAYGVYDTFFKKS